MTETLPAEQPQTQDPLMQSTFMRFLPLTAALIAMWGVMLLIPSPTLRVWQRLQTQQETPAEQQRYDRAAAAPTLPRVAPGRYELTQKEDGVTSVTTLELPQGAGFPSQPRPYTLTSRVTGPGKLGEVEYSDSVSGEAYQQGELLLLKAAEPTTLQLPLSRNLLKETDETGFTVLSVESPDTFRYERQQP